MLAKPAELVKVVPVSVPDARARRAPRPPEPRAGAVRVLLRFGFAFALKAESHPDRLTRLRPSGRSILMPRASALLSTPIPYGFSAVRLLTRGPGLAKARPSPSRTAPEACSALQIEQGEREVVIRVRLDGGTANTPIAITQRNCHLVGLDKREFLELVRTGVIRGGRVPGRSIVMARVEDVLAVIRARDDQCQEDPVAEVLSLVGYERSKAR